MDDRAWHDIAARRLRARDPSDNPARERLGPEDPTEHVYEDRRGSTAKRRRERAVTTMDMFGVARTAESQAEALGPGVRVLRGFATPDGPALLAALEDVIAQAPLRHMVTPGGFRMSVAMTNCGALGWVTDATGYRYDAVDPESGRHWPPMPDSFLRLATDAAAQAGFDGFVPDACLVNRYGPGSRLSLHQDRNERDFGAPIVSVSLGIPAVFLFGGLRRADRPARVHLAHGDVVVWGGAARLRYHGVMPLEAGHDARVGAHRINLTFRKAA